MQKREIMWIVALLVIVAFYYHFFGGRNGARPMVIHASLRPSRHGESDVFPVYFTLNDDFNLTSLKVVAVENGQVNPATMPVWNLVADGKPVPTRAFFYGEHIKGMKPALDGVHPDPLVAGVIYRILLSSGKVTASLDFKTRPTD